MAKTEQRHRSPNYPAVDLAKAVERTRVLYDRNKRHPVPVSVASETWGYKANSSASLQCIAALKAYGLIDVEGSAKSRRIRVSDTGWKIVGGHSDRDELLREAAHNPPLFLELLGKYGPDLPDDGVLRHYLVFDREEGTFNEDSVDSFIANFRETISFAKLIEDDKIRGDVPEIGATERMRSQFHAHGPKQSTVNLRQANQPVTRDLTIPLVGGDVAILRVPIPLSEENFGLITSLLATMKAALVSRLGDSDRREGKEREEEAGENSRGP